MNKTQENDNHAHMQRNTHTNYVIHIKNNQLLIYPLIRNKKNNISLPSPTGEISNLKCLEQFIDNF